MASSSDSGSDNAYNDDFMMLVSAVEVVKVDRLFDLETENAQKARLIAHKLLEAIWTNPCNKKSAVDLSVWLVNEMKACCTHSRPVTCRTFKEHMWEKFYKLCSSDHLRVMWSSFIKSTTGFNGSPLFYQFVTQSIFEQIIKRLLPACKLAMESKPVAHSVQSLDYEEENALRYCGGYIVKSLKDKIKKSTHSSKNELLLCIDDLLEDDDCDDDTEDNDSTDWFHAINRGGLTSVCDNFFKFLVAIELELREHIPTAAYARHCADNNLKEQAIKSISRNDDVLFYWEIVAVNWCSVEAQYLLNATLELYITMRGYSFAKGFMEKYKQKARKTTQKSKGLRKTLDNTTVCDREE